MMLQLRSVMRKQIGMTRERKARSATPEELAPKPDDDDEEEVNLTGNELSSDEEDRRVERKLRARSISERRSEPCGRRICTRTCRRDFMEILVITLLLWWCLSQLYDHYGEKVSEFIEKKGLWHGADTNDD